jgi:hypothetical protein
MVIPRSLQEILPDSICISFEFWFLNLKIIFEGWGGRGVRGENGECNATNKLKIGAAYAIGVGLGTYLRYLGPLRRLCSFRLTCGDASADSVLESNSNTVESAATHHVTVVRLGQISDPVTVFNWQSICDRMKNSEKLFKCTVFLWFKIILFS